MAYAGGGIGTVGFQMILVTFHIFEKSKGYRPNKRSNDESRWYDVL
jgi:hypothetical protein